MACGTCGEGEVLAKGDCRRCYYIKRSGRDPHTVPRRAAMRRERRRQQVKFENGMLAEIECTECLLMLSPTEFSPRKQSPYGVASVCKPCRRALRRRARGVDPERCAEPLADHCAICAGAGEVLDHDHATGAVRGTLCRRCNLLLGRVLDDPALLEAAAGYLQRHNNSNVVAST